MSYSPTMWLKSKWSHGVLVLLLLLTFLLPRPASAAACTYIVQGGDTLSAIARNNGTTVAAIVAANQSITNPNVIFVGQVITLPDCTTEEAPVAEEATTPQEVAPAPTAHPEPAPAVTPEVQSVPTEPPAVSTVPASEPPAVSTVPAPTEEPAPAVTVEPEPAPEESVASEPARPVSRVPQTVPPPPADLSATIWQQVHDATINIRHPIDDPLYSGSGIMIGSDGRTFLTAFHVIGNPATGFFTPLVSIGPFADWTYTAEVLAADPGLDLALLRVREDDFPGFAVAPLGNSDELDEMSPIYTFSYPGTQAELVTSKGHFLKSVASIRYRTPLILTDAAATFGSSGGVAVNERGEVIGIISAGVMNARIIENLGYIGLEQATLLVPINAATRMLQQTGVIQ